MLTNLESVFRSLKTDLGLRPVFHQIDRRVEGHLFISVLAYHFVHTLRLQLKPQGNDDSWETLRQTMATQQRARGLQHHLMTNWLLICPVLTSRHGLVRLASMSTAVGQRVQAASASARRCAPAKSSAPV